MAHNKIIPEPISYVNDVKVDIKGSADFVRMDFEL
jgi:hypothetical protein